LEAEQKPRKPKVNLTPVVRKDSSKAEAKAKAARETERREREAQEQARRRLAATIGRMANNLGSGLSSSTTIELKGPGGGGVPYANFLQAVKSVYARAWILPDGVTDDDATAVVTVTIARDGSVITHRIIKPSGNQAVDRSVRAALERVTFAAPLPDDAKEDQRTVSINFNVRAKRALG
jgi:colicin import membrane protein